jgi:hypothetical protein
MEWDSFFITLDVKTLRNGIIRSRKSKDRHNIQLQTFVEVNN